jgi:hypothetical protein
MTCYNEYHTDERERLKRHTDAWQTSYRHKILVRKPEDRSPVRTRGSKGKACGRSPEAWMSDPCDCCALSRRGLCDRPIPRPEEFYRLWCITVCDLEGSKSRRPWPTLGCCARESKYYINILSRTLTRSTWFQTHGQRRAPMDNKRTSSFINFW